MLSILLIFSYNYYCTFTLKHYLKETYETTSRIASISHAIITPLLSLMYIYNLIDFSIYQYSVWYNIIYISTDIYLFLTKRISIPNVYVFILHHIIFIIASFVSPIIPVYYARGILSEISTIFLNLLWFSKHNKIHFTNEKLYNFLLWINFLIFRIINLNRILYELYNSNYYQFSILLIPFIVLNNMWFYLLTKKIIIKYLNNK